MIDEQGRTVLQCTPCMSLRTFGAAGRYTILTPIPATKSSSYARAYEAEIHPDGDREQHPQLPRMAPRIFRAAGEGDFGAHAPPCPVMRVFEPDFSTSPV